ncbi:molybdopterin-dependent oxidoreductase [Streptacidiphilus monticola]|uniref:Molybdopterin-dependent oxidoreductase n=1 Tax=Streptacidiphilus monticola TaxID=2161674 RepID=A0ABW1G9R5_9ACTN
MSTGKRQPSRPRWWRRGAPAALTGLAAAAAAIGAGELVAAFTGADSSPVLAVGSQAIDLTPTPLKDYAVRTFGTHDKFVLLSGIHATLVLLALAAGVLSARWRPAGVAVFLLFAGVGAWVAAVRAVAVWPALTAGTVGAVVLWWLSGLGRRACRSESSGPTRRTVLGATGGVLAVGVVADLGGRALAGARSSVAAARAGVRLPAPAHPGPALPPRVHPDIAGLSPFTTANRDFYRVDTALTLPQIDPRRWSLRVHGMVDRPLELDFDQLLRLPLEELDYTLSCVSNEVGGPYVGTARWLGASLPALLRRAGVRAGADQLVGRSKDHMSIGTPLDSVLDGRPALLAVGMNGEPLPVAHGFPCRSVVPGFYGYTSATKWLVDLEVTAFAAYSPYWVERGWDRHGVVRTASRIEVPAPFAHLRAGAVMVAGTAWATHRGIAAVEVRVDGGPWRQAHLAEAVGPDTWRQWTWEWADAQPGTHTLQVRATDATGATQPEQRQPPFPAGATGWHGIVAIVE